MLERRGEPANGSLDRREMLKAEYARLVERGHLWLTGRLNTSFLVVDRSTVLADPAEAALSLARFLDRPAFAAQMAAVVDRSLHRNRR